jgi:hypothetical protein
VWTVNDLTMLETHWNDLCTESKVVSLPCIRMALLVSCLYTLDL